MIFGASSFAGPLLDLKSHVRFVELYIPKLGVYQGSKLEIKKVDRILDEISVYKLETTVHAPYSAADAKYPLELQIDTSKMGEREFSLMEESIALANRIGAEIVVLHPGRIGPDRVKSFSNMIQNLSVLADMAEEFGVLLGLENKEGTDSSNFCCKAEELVSTIEAVNSESLKATFDIGHANLTCKGDPEKLKNFVWTLDRYIAHIHLHDNSGQWTEKYDGDEHLVPGKGCTDYSVLNLLSGYKGVYNLEVFSIDDVCLGKEIIKSFLKF